jgi:hypothetical protein
VCGRADQLHPACVRLPMGLSALEARQERMMNVDAPPASFWERLFDEPTGNDPGGARRLRCVYHGWKYDVTSAVTDMPAEPPRCTHLANAACQLS